MTPETTSTAIPDDIWFIRPENHSFAEGRGRTVVTPEQVAPIPGMLAWSLMIAVAFPIWLVMVFVQISSGDKSLSLTIGGGLIGFVILAIMIVRENRISMSLYQRNARLTHEGKIVFGRVLGCFAPSPLLFEGFDSRTPIWLRYRFVSPDSGQEITRIRHWRVVSSYFPASLRFKKPEQGQPIAILFVNDQLYEIL